MSSHNQTSNSRRRFIKQLAGGAAALGGGAALSPLLAQSATALPPAINTLTPGSVLRWIDSGDQKAVFYKAFFQQYAQDRGIEVIYDPLPWNEIAKVVPLGVRNKTAHDVFALPQNSNPADAVSEGWLQPYDDFIPDIESWKAGFPEGAFLPGINVFGGKTYGLPFTSNKRSSTHLLFNRNYLQEAGFDPESKSLTQSDFREAARKITENGKGRYFGFILGGNQIGRWSAIVRDIARLSGASAGADSVVEADIDFRTGEYTFDSDQYIEAIELLIALQKDGSMFPGVMGINAPQARAFMPQGAAGMILQGPWNIPAWESQNPEFDFGIGSAPLPDEGPAGHLTIGQGAAAPNTMWLWSGSANGAIAGDIFHYLGTLQGQTAWANVVGAGDPPIMPEAIEKADMSPRAKAVLQLFNEQIRVGPNPVVGTPALSSVVSSFQAPDLSFALTVQGLVGGQLKDVGKEMKALKTRYDDALNQAFDKARANGSDVSRDDLVFANWDPATDFGSKNY